MSSCLKLFEQFLPDFTSDLLSNGYCQFVQMVPHHQTKWLPSPYGKCPKISNTLKFRSPNIFAQNNFWKCPKISNSSSFAKRGFLKFRTQLASNNFLSAHSNFSFSVTEPEIKVAVLKATAKRNCTQQCHNEFYVHKWQGNRILIYTNPGDSD